MKPYQRWRLAVAAINISQYLASLAKKVVVSNTQLITGITHSPSYSIIDIQHEDDEPEDHLLANIDQDTSRHDQGKTPPTFSIWRSERHGHVLETDEKMVSKDPCRPRVKTAVESCRDAGVNVKMITGDNVFTAKAIATECGILDTTEDLNSGAIVEGKDFRNFSDQERMEKVETIRVMARSSPFDKLLMVQCLKQKGHVVAVTGDGANDAPALKEADIGLSMGIQGTEVAKESSDIVILDDNFTSVVTVLRWGRCVYDNIQKFIQFQLTVNVAAHQFCGQQFFREVPLSKPAIVVNLIMDTFGALALAESNPPMI
ncbi:putative calcium-transporting ATPase 13, plasma membrane-type [Camellia lanceoleosa]|uniref:Calcium-transporting ATPase 13, plasma membrane-type n=1 Tax=Camellia lanceoleosa TaxID=1840588 RepID=A0ACC0IAF5_9ERIC|nr:putative calcium-transporting ATPase 13, plasma membrane-type [Camellia lanceoleosa]